MTEDELQVARAKEAVRRVHESFGTACTADLSIALMALSLVEEGWTPPDPLEKEISELYDWYNQGCASGQITDGRELVRKALQRGIAIGRGEK